MLGRTASTDGGRFLQKGPPQREGGAIAERVLVTGASRGIGRAIALALAVRGWEVICTSRDPLKGRRTADAISDTGGRAIACEMDVASRASAEKAISWAWREMGPIDGLVHAAGISATTPFVAIPGEEWRTVIETNLGGTFNVCQALARRMVESEVPGAFVIVTSQLARVAASGKAHYAASKGGVETLVRVMAIELARHHIRVNALAPGLTDTEMVRPRLAADLEFRRQMLSRIPLGRLGQPEEMTAAAAFLLGNEASYVTGSTLTVDGGYLAT